MRIRKGFLLFPLIFFALLSCSKHTINRDQLVERNDIFYEVNSVTPFGGTVQEFYENGQLRSKQNFKNGKEEGEFIGYHKNGQLWYKGNYKNGKEEGDHVEYHENGQLWAKGNYKNGKKEGEHVVYYENGQIEEKCNYKNGVKEGMC